MVAPTRTLVALFLVLAQLVPVGFAAAATCGARAQPSCCGSESPVADAAGCCHDTSPVRAAPDARAPACTCCATPPPTTPPVDAPSDAVVVAAAVDMTVQRPPAPTLGVPPIGRAHRDARPAPRPPPRPPATSVFLL